MPESYYLKDKAECDGKLRQNFTRFHRHNLNTCETSLEESKYNLVRDLREKEGQGRPTRQLKKNSREQGQLYSEQTVA